MVINSATVAMSSTRKYEVNTKTSTSVKFTPILLSLKEQQEGLASQNYRMTKDGGVQEVDDTNSGSFINFDRKIKNYTINFLLRLLFGKRDDYNTALYNQMYSDISQNTRGMAVMETDYTYEYHEVENTSFVGQGTVVCQDGREISFNYELSMSQEFYESCSSYTARLEEIALCDPLVINLDSNPASVSDQKFYFDLDQDGVEENINMLGSGSGFLALDRNDDGVINDGSELFGTKTGNGFADLAKYDDDGNGWIDEADEIFSKLKIWTMDEHGNSKLITLKDADVGAICLRNINTGFNLRDGSGALGGVIRNTGIYLKESTGKAGSIQHLDMAT